MSSARNAVFKGNQVPRIAIAPRAKWTDGDDACFLASSYGLTPDPWQCGVVNGWMQRKADGRWASSTWGLAVPRQNGKNGCLEVVELYLMVVLGLKILHTAHEVKTARKAFLRLCSFFENKRQHPELADMVKDIRRTNGQEAIFLTNGASIEFIARSKGSGRGFTVDVLVCDEAQEMSDDALEALTPTISAAPSGDPITIFTGTPPSPSMNGEVWTRVRKSAVKRTDRRIAFYEWSIPTTKSTVELDAYLNDEKAWADTNPALGYRLNIATIRTERKRFSDAGFARERLGMWLSEAGTFTVVPRDTWTALAVEADQVPDAPPSAFSVDMSHARLVSIGVCVKDGDFFHVELAELDYASDTLLIVDWLVKRAGRRIPVAIDAQSPAASLVPALRARKVKVIVTNALDMSKACGAFYDDVKRGRLTHFNQEQLNEALEGAKKRKIGMAGGWGWDRADEDADVSPLVAVTLARFAASVTKRRTGTKTRVVVMA